MNEIYCDNEVYKKGSVFEILDVSKEKANEYCIKLSIEDPSYKYDWHYDKGRVIIKRLKSECIMNNTIKANQLAEKYHGGQVDKGGNPYIHHIRRVYNEVDDYWYLTRGCNKDYVTKLNCVAILHDIIEDTSCTLDDLRQHNFSEDVIEAIDVLTKKSDQEYSEYVSLVINNSLARKVKIADLRDNMDLTRLGELSNKDIVRYNKYCDFYGKLIMKEFGL